MIRLVTRQAGDVSASSYYRHQIPVRVGEKLNRVDLISEGMWPLDINKAEWQHELIQCMTLDAVLNYSSLSVGVMGMIDMLKAHRKKGNQTPAFMYDLDDNTHFVNPINPAFGKLGTRYPDGTLLKPGGKIEIDFPDGSTEVLWADGKEGFDIQENLDRIGRINHILKNVDGVTASTNRLADYFKRKLKLKNVYVFPNSIIEEDWPTVKHHQHAGTVRVLWQGANAHYADWFEIKQGLERCVKKFPEITWVVWGSVYPWIHKVIPSDKLEIHKWVPYEAYRYKLATIDFDFALAPLVPNKFNEGKSSIKWYEAAMMNRPCIMRNTPPYSDEAVHEENCLMYTNNDEFVDCVEKMVRFPKMRKRLADNAKSWILEKRNALDTVPPYLDWIEQTKKEGNKSGRKRYSQSSRKKSLRNMQKSVSGKS